MSKADIVFENIKTRRSVRKFSDKQISDENLKKLLEAGRWAPSGANAQPWEFIVLKDKDVNVRISEACYYKVLKSRHVGEANVNVVILGNPKAGSATYVQDCTIAGANMTLMANSLDIGSCWIGAFEDSTIRGILNIPDNLKIIALISFGYQVKRPSLTKRLEQKDFVHFGNYSGSSPKIRKITRTGPLSVFGKIIRVFINRRR
ncbi:MAG: hypothetical protein C4562_04585 [Actinobacteria bacterium]|nr:MAG: hypothetical protein C4562_04585 [Actinomycetota bacterium]